MSQKELDRLSVVERCAGKALRQRERARLLGISVRQLRRLIRRFGELGRLLPGISQKVLTSQLKELQASGFVLRKVYAEVPPKVEYSLTENGKSLYPVLDALVM